MSEFDDDIPFGLTPEVWRQMLQDIEKRSKAASKRSETMRAKAEAKRAERLALPPRDVKEAWRRHAESCPYLAGSDAARNWFRENRRFTFDGTEWRRERTTQTSNSGKSQIVRSIIYYADDGREIVEFDDGPNRRNDTERDWGLPD